MASTQEILFNRPIDAPAFNSFDVPGGVVSLRNHVDNIAIPRGDLRLGQTEGLLKTVKLFEEGERVVYVEQASGYGKSRLMEEIGKGFGGRQIYVTNGKTGSENIEGKLAGRYDIGRVDKDHREFGHSITIITMQSLYKLVGRVQKRPTKEVIAQARFLFNADLVFADEVHHYLTPKALAVLSLFLQQNPKSVMIGASATEGYDALKTAEVQFGKCAHRVSLVEAEGEGVLISPHVSYVKTGVSLDKSKVTPDGTIMFDASIPVKERDRKLLQRYLDTCIREGKRLRAISYLSTIEHAYNFAELANEMGIPTAIVIGETKNRTAIYERLRRREFAMVATVETAIEGLDLQWLEAIIVSMQTRSMRVARQMFPRPMRNIKGKDNPWIIQAIDERTLFKNRPVLATDILNVKRFVNGGVIKPRREYEEGAAAYLDIERGPYYRGAGEVELREGQEVDVEIIDVNSLFRMGILDRAKLLGQGMLPKKDAEELRKLLRDFLENIYKGEKFPSLNNQYIGGLQIYDGNSDEHVSFSRIIKEACGLDSTFNIRQEHGNVLIDFLNTGKFIPVENNGKNADNSDFVDPEFADLCKKYKEGNVTEDELRLLAANLGDLLKDMGPSDWSQVTSLKGFKISGDRFNGTIERLSKFLGINTGIDYFSAKSRDVLLEFINEYGNRKIDIPVRKDADLITLPNVYGDIEDVRDFLRRVFKQAENEGWDIKSVITMEGYRIETKNFSGRFIVFLRMLLNRNVRQHGSLTKHDLLSLLAHAGIEI